MSDLLPASHLAYNIGSLTKTWKNIAVQNIISDVYMADEKLFGVGKFTTLPIVGSGARGCLAYRAIDTADDSLWIYHRNAAGGWDWKQILLMSSLLCVTNDIIPDEDWTRFLGSSIKNWWAVYTHGLYVTTDSDIWVGANLVPDGTQNLGSDSDSWQDIFASRYVKIGKVDSLPAADASYRGKKIRVEGGAGVADILYMCMKRADDTYAWIQIASG